MRSIATLSGTLRAAVARAAAIALLLACACSSDPLEDAGWERLDCAGGDCACTADADCAPFQDCCARAYRCLPSGRVLPTCNVACIDPPPAPDDCGCVKGSCGY